MRKHMVQIYQPSTITLRKEETLCYSVQWFCVTFPAVLFCFRTWDKVKIYFDQDGFGGVKSFGYVPSGNMLYHIGLYSTKTKVGIYAKT